MISYNEALNIINENFQLLPKDKMDVNLLDSLNHVLGEDIVSDINQPAFDNSAVDGFAIILTDNNRTWELIGEISAGNFSHFPLSPNTTVSIMTGAKIPSGCTAIIPIEDVSLHGNHVSLNEGAKIFKGINIRLLGENLKVGQITVPQNTLITASHISSLADCGKSIITINKPLKVGIFSTGDELVDIDKIPTEDKIRATNIYSILALLKENNLIGINLGFSNDDREVIKEKVRLAFDSDIDILLTTGGVSVGKYDFLKEVFEELGVERKFWRAYIKPGKPLYFGILKVNGNNKLVFGLAGNPVSSFVNLHAFLIPALEKFYNVNFNNKFYAITKSIFKKKDSKRHFVRARFTLCDKHKTYEVSTEGSQSSANMAGLSNSNCLVVLDEEKNIFEKGDIVECIKI